jgi:DNA-binding beta-propeller fold protein YncE
VAVVALGGGKTKAGAHVTGLIPTGWYPTAVAAAGGRLYVVNGKSDPGPNPLACRNTLSLKREDAIPCTSSNSYVWQLEKAGFLALPTPTAPELAKLTRQVASNVGFTGGPGVVRDAAVMAAIRARIKHVIYIVKENRTYDQVLGDLEVGDGDPKLAVFPRAMTPNQHALARQFVDLDRFFASGESSNTGWDWSTAARTTDFTEREAPVNYGGRGLQYDQEGPNRNINVGIGDHAARVAASASTPKDPDLLPGTADVAAPDGPEGQEGQGYIWDAALRAGLSVRNYGFFTDLDRYEFKAPDVVPLERDPFSKKLQVFFSAKPALIPRSDLYFRGFDQAFPDFWRFQEWKREFDGYAAKGDLPALTLLRLPHDHTGRFAEAIDGVNTVEKELADNDYAVGLVVQTIAQSRFSKDTLIFIVEDDAQDGPDHISARRTTAYVAGPYVRQHAVVSRHYTTVGLIRTMEDVLGLAPLSLNDGLARPMSEIFDPKQAAWDFKAQVPEVLRSTALPLPARTAQAEAPAITCHTPRTAEYWAKAMAGLNFDEEDHLDTARYNRALWIGMTGKAAYPRPTGADLSRDAKARSGKGLCG